MLKQETDPTGVTTQYVYDNDGNTIATQTNSDPWTCYTYDARQRVTQEAIPALANTSQVKRTARTISYNYAVGGNPLVTSESDASGTLTTTTDLLGRTTIYADTFNTSPTRGGTYTYTTNYTYDNLGRESTISAAGGTESYTYDNTNRVTAVKYNNVTLASPTYDAYGRLHTVTYPSTTSSSLGLTLSRDSLGRENDVSYTTYNSGTLIDSDTLSQSSKVIAATDNGIAQTYAYDGADRLTNETYGNLQWTYGFGTPTGCTGNYNPNAGKDSNRTSQVETQNGSQIVNYTYCYNNADQLISSTNPEFTSATYDSHGNLSNGSSTYDVNLQYDSSDRIAYFTDNQTAGASILMDPANRVYYENQELNYDVYSDDTDSPAASFGNTVQITERYIQLPGGVMATIENVTGSPAVTSTEYSLPDLQGNVFGTTGGAGSLSSIDQYDAFGQRLGNSTPENTTAADYFGDHGQSGILTDGLSANQFTFMGSRLYIPGIGRFAQTDPIEDGNANAYVYPTDPVNNSDTDGMSKLNSTSGQQYDTPNSDEWDAYFQKEAGLRYNHSAYKRWVDIRDRNLKVQGKKNKQKRNKKDDDDRNNPTGPPNIPANPYDLLRGSGGNRGASPIVLELPYAEPALEALLLAF